MSRWSLLAFVALWAACATTGTSTHGAHQAARSSETSNVGFVVAAPDRGFLGDEEIRDAFAEFAQGRRAQLVFVTDERTRAELDAAVAVLEREGARQIVVLPLFLTEADLGFQRLTAMLAESGGKLPVTMGRRFGQSYLAVELLADRFRSIPEPKGRRIVVLGYGAKDASTRQSMGVELQRIADLASAGFGFEAVRVVTWLDRSALSQTKRDTEGEAALVDAIGQGKDAAVIPFQLGPKLDSMMSFTAGVAQQTRGLAHVVNADVTPDPLVAQWLVRESNRHIPLSPEETGVVVLAHGSDHHWNEGMRKAADALAKRYKVEFAFCMADPPLVERAIRRLEARGARGIVVVRVFGLASSFRAGVEHMLGLDVEAADVNAHHAGHGGGHDHGHGHGAPVGPPPPRIRSTALLATVGGLEDSPLFADALLDRALALSKDPGRETVILVAHGSGDDTTNDHWKTLLESLAKRMRSGAGAKFRAVHYGTWREDWPDKRKPEIAAIRALVEAASRDGGRALVIPARTSAQGFETEFLEGLTFTIGQGFAPHPLFERWLEEQVKAGVALLGPTTASPASPAPVHDHEHHGHH